MAFTFTVTRITVFGDRKVAYGTWTATAATSGNIVTGLTIIDNSLITNKTGLREGTAVDDSTTNGTIALSGVTASDTGEWFAVGV